jgi:hypothetical protein
MKPNRMLSNRTSILASSFILSLVAFVGIRSASAQTPCGPPNASQPCHPYTPEERFKHYLRHSAGPQALLFSGMSAGIGQARNAPSEWEQGMEGFGRRFGSSMAQRAASEAIELPVEWALGEDSRYVRSDKGGLWPRIGDVLKHSLMVRTVNGSRQIPIGVLAGSFGGGLVSRAWQPDGHRKVSQGIASGVYSFGFYLGTNAFAEFWPDLHRHLHF